MHAQDVPLRELVAMIRTNRAVPWWKQSLYLPSWFSNAFFFCEKSSPGSKPESRKVACCAVAPHIYALPLAHLPAAVDTLSAIRFQLPTGLSIPCHSPYEYRHDLLYYSKPSCFVPLLILLDIASAATRTLAESRQSLKRPRIVCAPSHKLFTQFSFSPLPQHSILAHFSPGSSILGLLANIELIVFTFAQVVSALLIHHRPILLSAACAASNGRNRPAAIVKSAHHAIQQLLHSFEHLWTLRAKYKIVQNRIPPEIYERLSVVRAARRST